MRLTFATLPELSIVAASATRPTACFLFWHSTNCKFGDPIMVGGLTSPPTGSGFVGAFGERLAVALGVGVTLLGLRGSCVFAAGSRQQSTNNTEQTASLFIRSG